MEKETSSGIVVDGRARVAKANRAEIEKTVRAKYAEELAEAHGLFRRWRLNRKIRSEIAEALEKLAPGGALYAKNRMTD